MQRYSSPPGATPPPSPSLAPVPALCARGTPPAPLDWTDVPPERGGNVNVRPKLARKSHQPFQECGGAGDSGALALLIPLCQNLSSGLREVALVAPVASKCSKYSEIFLPVYRGAPFTAE